MITDVIKYNAMQWIDNICFPRNVNISLRKRHNKGRGNKRFHSAWLCKIRAVEIKDSSARDFTTSLVLVLVRKMQPGPMNPWLYYVTFVTILSDICYYCGNVILSLPLHSAWHRIECQQPNNFSFWWSLFFSCLF